MTYGIEFECMEELHLWSRCLCNMVNEHCVNDAILRCDAAVSELRQRIPEAWKRKVREEAK